jgi:hypothetical protein
VSLDDEIEWAGARVQVASRRYLTVHDHYTRGRAGLHEVNCARLEWERATFLLDRLHARKAVAA